MTNLTQNPINNPYKTLVTTIQKAENGFILRIGNKLLLQETLEACLSLQAQAATQVFVPEEPAPQE